MRAGDFPSLVVLLSILALLAAEAWAWAGLGAQPPAKLLPCALPEGCGLCPLIRLSLIAHTTPSPHTAPVQIAAFKRAGRGLCEIPLSKGKKVLCHAALLFLSVLSLIICQKWLHTEWIKIL